MLSFGDRVRDRLKELKWTQAMLATNAMMPPSMLSRLLNNFDENLCRPQTLARITRALGVNSEWLITGEDPKYPVKESTTSLEFMSNDGLSRMRAVVEAVAEYFEEKGYKVPPDLLADKVIKLFLASIRASTYDATELKKILTGERNVDAPIKEAQDTDQTSEKDNKERKSCLEGKELFGEHHRW